MTASGSSDDANGRDNWPYCYTSLSPAPASAAASSTGVRTRPPALPLENPVQPLNLLATIYHSIGLDPHTMVYNHFNQPHEMVQGDVVTRILS